MEQETHRKFYASEGYWPRAADLEPKRPRRPPLAQTAADQNAFERMFNAVEV
eukprot:SAG11_NODE_23499_length_387_cov_1.781250_1_plen_52_part_01